MCVTSLPADITATKVVVGVSNTPGPEGHYKHWCAYQNSLLGTTRMSEGPGCMFLHFPAEHELELVRGPELYEGMMFSFLRGIQPLYKPEFVMLGGSSRGLLARVEEYGDYTVVIANGTGQFEEALKQVREDRRPRITTRMRQMFNFYAEYFPGYKFVLACYDQSARPKHPIVVAYEPQNDDVLFVPTLDAHDGLLPQLGKNVVYDFQIGFSIAGVDLPHAVNFHYLPTNEAVLRDSSWSGSVETWWRPKSVVGFGFNIVRPNSDLYMPTQTLTEWAEDFGDQPLDDFKMYDPHEVYNLCFS